METKTLRGLGYWRNESDDSTRAFPHPRTLQRPGWLPAQSRVQLLEYLRSAPVLCEYRGLSHCRFECGVDHRVMGWREHWDGIWVWPEGLAHYVEHHDVALPDEFIQHALSVPVPDRLLTPKDVNSFLSLRKINWDYWIEWSHLPPSHE